MDKLQFVYVSDVVNVVRCKNCKYYEVEDYYLDNMPILAASNVPTCHKWSKGCVTNPNGYCHLGERRDGET